VVLPSHQLQMMADLLAFVCSGARSLLASQATRILFKLQEDGHEEVLAKALDDALEFELGLGDGAIMSRWALEKRK
jgi:hypothetical protein